MRLKQYADAYHCEIVLALFVESNTMVFIACFHPLNVQKCCSLKHLKSEVYILWCHPLDLSGYCNHRSETAESWSTIFTTLRNQEIDTLHFNNRCGFSISIGNSSGNVTKPWIQRNSQLSDSTSDIRDIWYKYEIFIAPCTDKEI